MRFTVAVENYNWQHQDLRTENGVEYGDTIDKMDFPYLRRVTQLNVAALAALASAPTPPAPTVEGAVSTDTTLSWPRVAAPQPTSSAGAGPTPANWRSLSVRTSGRLDGCPPPVSIAEARRST